MNLSEVDKLHARYLIGFWRKSFFARGYRLGDTEEDPPVVRELKNLLFWTDDDDLTADESVRKYFHVQGLEELIKNAELEVDRLIKVVETGEEVQESLSKAEKQLEIAKAAGKLLEIMTNGR